MSSEAPTAKCILVVEDDETIRDWLVVVLHRAGYAVNVAMNGKDALAYLERGATPDLILLDMLMPVVDGWRFLEQLRQLGPARTIPVIVTTGTILTKEWAHQHDCISCIRKPVDERELVAEVQRCLTDGGPKN